MDASLFNKILNSDIPDHASFAIWDVNDITNVDIITQNVSKLTTSIVIVGLNPSGGKPIEHGKIFRSYHCSYRGCKDKYLRAGFQEGSKLFVGAYMTDIVWRNPSVKSNFDVAKEDLNQFVKELESIEFYSSKHSLIISLGDKVYSALTEGTNIFKNISIEKVSHHARRGYTKDRFVKEIHDLEDKLHNLFRRSI